MDAPPAPLQPHETEALYRAGVAALHAGDTSAAVGFFERAVAADPKNVNALFNLGNALVSLQRYAEADARYGEAIALKPNSAPIHANRGAALAKLNRVEDAIASYDRAIALKPDFFEALKNRGSALYAAGRHDEAVASYDRAVAVNPRDAMTLAQRGTALMATRRFGAAAESYSAAFAIEPDYGFRLQRLHARMAACAWGGFDVEVQALEPVPAHGLKRTSPYPLIAPLDSPAALRALAIGHRRERYPEDATLGPPPGANAQRNSASVISRPISTIIRCPIFWSKRWNAMTATGSTSSLFLMARTTRTICAPGCASPSRPSWMCGP